MDMGWWKYCYQVFFLSSFLNVAVEVMVSQQTRLSLMNYKNIVDMGIQEMITGKMYMISNTEKNIRNSMAVDRYAC